MLHAFIDESGDEGVKSSSSPWLCLGGFVIPESDMPGMKLRLAEGVDKIWHPQKPPNHVHFCQIGSHSKRKALLSLLSGMNFTAIVIAAKKDAFTPELLANMKCPNLYNYLAKHIMERFSWFANDSNQQIRLSFASRNDNTWKDLRAYFDLLKTLPDKHQIKLPQLASMGNLPANVNSLIQAADWITSSFADGVNPDKYGDVETMYAEKLWGKFWVRKGNLWSYGIKVIPKGVDRKAVRLFRKIDTWLEDPTSIA